MSWPRRKGPHISHNSYRHLPLRNNPECVNIDLEDSLLFLNYYFWIVKILTIFEWIVVVGCLFTVTQLGWVHKYKMSLSGNISPLENWILDPQEASRRWQTISKMLCSASTCHQTWARRQARDNEYICIENEATWSYFTAVLRELKKEFASFKL